MLFDPSAPAARLAQCPVHAETPFGLKRIGGRDLLVKEEGFRMGAGSFKGLGGAYAVLRMTEDAAGRLGRDARRAAAADMTFTCASAGNHGLSVAIGARLFGAQARIYLADTVPESFADRLRAEDAEVVRAGAVYEEAVAAADAWAEETGAIHLADGSWQNYRERPRLVMEGYTVIAEEMREALEATRDWPDAVYLQAGVGGLACAVAERIRAAWSVQPRIVVVEPEFAPCLKASVAAGEMVTVEGPVSEMGRLDCKTASLTAFESLRETADAFETVSEEEAAEAAQLAGAAGMPTTPSGAAGLAAALRAGDARPLVILSETAA